MCHERYPHTLRTAVGRCEDAAVGRADGWSASISGEHFPASPSTSGAWAVRNTTGVPDQRTKIWLQKLGTEVQVMSAKFGANRLLAPNLNQKDLNNLKDLTGCQLKEALVGRRILFLQTRNRSRSYEARIQIQKVTAGGE